MIGYLDNQIKEVDPLGIPAGEEVYLDNKITIVKNKKESKKYITEVDDTLEANQKGFSKMTNIKVVDLVESFRMVVESSVDPNMTPVNPAQSPYLV